MLFSSLIREASIDDYLQGDPQLIKVQKIRNCGLSNPKWDISITPLPLKS